MQRVNLCLYGVVILLFSVLVLSHCSSDEPAGNNYPMESAGGTITFTDSAHPGVSVTLDFPAGAVSDGTVITIGRPSSYPASANLVPNTVFSFGPTGDFGAPVTLTITYDAASLGGLTESSLALHTVSGGVWVEVTGTVDTTGHSVTADINSFSTWGVLEAVPVVDTDGDGTPDSQDCAPNDSNIHPGAEETCNDGGVDNNCNGEVDEGCSCTEATSGATQACEVANAYGTCTGTETCDPSVGWSACNAPTPMPEVCDGVDNNCDGFVDEGYPKSAANGSLQCNAGSEQLTCNSGYENCNGVLADGCEVDISFDTDNCGMCGNVCAGGQFCSNAVCQ